MKDKGCDIGLFGLGVMGRNFVLNMADRGFSVGVFNRTTEKTRKFMEQSVGDRDIRAGFTVSDFLALLSRPRAVLLSVPAGEPVDRVIDDIVLGLEPGDVIADMGNSHFTDTDRRARVLREKGLLYLGVGISGGAHGARRGPSIMPGGDLKGYDRIRPIVEVAAAKVDGSPCVAYLGPGSAGHYVKMVHNGIEYGIMQLIAESYDLMHRGMGLNAQGLHRVYSEWATGELSSYLIEITSEIFLRNDEKTEKPLVDMILDQAKQKGTGKWTSVEAFELQVPLSTLHAAVSERDMSGYKEERKRASEAYQRSHEKGAKPGKSFIDRLEDALYVGMMSCFAQGMALLHRASRIYEYHLDLETVASIWRGGCIIRAGLLENIRKAYATKPDLSNVLLDPEVCEAVTVRDAGLREVVSTASRLSIPAPGLMAALSYLDSYLSERLPANLIMAQRDYFGAHRYERIDAGGTFHSQWMENEEEK